jgi:hypothetical protein
MDLDRDQRQWPGPGGRSDCVDLGRGVVLATSRPHLGAVVGPQSLDSPIHRRGSSSVDIEQPVPVGTDVHLPHVTEARSRVTLVLPNREQAYVRHIPVHGSRTGLLHARLGFEPCKLHPTLCASDPLRFAHPSLRTTPAQGSLYCTQAYLCAVVGR